MKKNQNSGCLLGLFSLFDTPKRKRHFYKKKRPEVSYPSPSYRRKYLLTKNELHFYKELKKVADKYNLTILSKIRMADLVEPRSTGKAYYSEFAKIKAKHIDFALCDPSNLYVRILIELDDNSHKADSTIERDEFVESVYRATGYKLYRTNGTATLERDLTILLGQAPSQEPLADTTEEKTSTGSDTITPRKTALSNLVRSKKV